MLTDLLKKIRENPQLYKEGIAKKNCNVEIIDKILSLDKEYRSSLAEVEFLRAHLNELSQNDKFSQDHLEQARATKQRIKDLEKELTPIENELDKLLYQIPNLPLEDVPLGKDESENKVLREVGKKPKFKFEPQD